MPITVVVGCQWGDEGKGKIVDRLAARRRLGRAVLRGAQRGHTVRVGSETFVLHLIPSGILHPRRALRHRARRRHRSRPPDAGDRGARGTGDPARRAPLPLRRRPRDPPLPSLDRGAARDRTSRVGTTRRGIGPGLPGQDGSVRAADGRPAAIPACCASGSPRSWPGSSCSIGRPAGRCPSAARTPSRTLDPTLRRDRRRGWPGRSPTRSISSRRARARRADPLRGEPGDLPRHRHGDLSLRDLVVDDGGRGGDGARTSARGAAAGSSA